MEKAVPKKQERPADPAPAKWYPGIKKREPVRELSESTFTPASASSYNGHRVETVQKDKKTYLEEQVSIEVETGSVYIYNVVNFESKLEFSTCEKKSKGKESQTLEHYAYVSFDRLSNQDLVSKLKGVSQEHIVLERTKLIGELREENYKGSNGRMIYLNKDGEIKASPASMGCPIIVPKYIDVDGDVIPPNYQR